MHLLKEFSHYLLFHQVQQYLTIIERRLRMPDETNLFMSTPNPLKTVVLIMEFNHILKLNYDFSSGQVNEINQMLTRMAQKFCKEIYNERDIEIMLLDTTYAGLEVLEVIIRHQFIDLLSTPVVDNVVSQFWAGSYERDIFPMNTSKACYIIGKTFEH